MAQWVVKKGGRYLSRVNAMGEWHHDAWMAKQADGDRFSSERVARHIADVCGARVVRLVPRKPR